MSQEVAPGVFALTSPFPNEPRMSVNAYVLEGPDAWILIDTGWDAQEARALLEEHVAARRADWSVLDAVLVTHLHPDHFGLMWLTREKGRARLAYHMLESRFSQPRFSRWDEFHAQVRAWDRLNGWPDDDFPMTPSLLAVIDHLKAPPPDLELVGGEIFENGRHRLRAVWTPGHTAGHVCFFEERHGLLFTGDHLLPEISPNVALHSQSLGSPLADFLDSLALVRELPVSRFLPGHGPASDSLARRVDELLAHHESRLAEMQAALGDADRDAATSAYEVARRVKWTRRAAHLDSLQPHHRRLALGETLAHLELLRTRGRARREARDGGILYGPAV